MSSSIPDSAIFTTDSQDVAKKKIMKSFSGGAPSLKEHREKGGNPHVDSACQYLLYMFEEDDDKVKEIFSSYQKGELSSGEVKNMLAKKVCAFLENHQKKREHAKKHIEEFLFNSNS
jgi:tryptophanyl-tRNA synthetase